MESGVNSLAGQERVSSDTSRGRRHIFLFAFSFFSCSSLSVCGVHSNHKVHGESEVHADYSVVVAG